MTHTPKALKLENRAVLKLGGPEVRPFLQGLITNDIKKLTADSPLYAALLTPQGKYLFDFIMYAMGDDIYLDCEAARKDDLIKRLTFYRLRANVSIEDVSATHSVFALSPITPPLDPQTEAVSLEWKERSFYLDPRCDEVGFRGVAEGAPEGLETWEPAEYEALRLSLGIPDGARDIELDKRFILEANLAELNGVDFKKGCYVGQEMTARMNYRGTLKKRLLPAKIDGPLPAPGTPMKAGGKDAGHVLSGQGDTCITLTRLEKLGNTPFETAEGTKITPYAPGWLTLKD